MQRDSGAAEQLIAKHLLDREVGDHGSMVRRFFKLARSTVDDAGATIRGQLRRRQYMVDAHTGVAAKAQHAVVPPGKTLLGLLEQAVAIDHALIQQSSPRSPLLRADQYVAFPSSRIVHVTDAAGTDERALGAHMTGGT